MKIINYHRTKDVYLENYLHNPFGELSGNSTVNLKEYRKTIRSQTGEDGIIEHVFSKITPRSRFCVEFGASDGEWLSNTWNLRNNHGWQALLMDSDPGAVDRSNGQVQLENITSSNINDLFSKYHVPENLDFLSIDIDGDDLYIFDALDARYRPILICGEYNPGLPNHLPLVIEEGLSDYGPNRRNKSNPYDYHGCNIHAWHKVGQRKGYTVLTTNSHVNAFLIANEYVDKFNIPKLEDLCVPPYFVTEYNRFKAGASNEENYFWCEIE
jgi:hypothetical protein